MLNNFIYAKKKSLFTKELEAGNVLNEAIVFIEDTKQIWNHGTYFDCNTSTFESTLDQYALKSDLDNYALKSSLSSYATLSSLANKVDKVSGKQLSTEDFTTSLKTKLEGINVYKQHYTKLSGIPTSNEDGWYSIANIQDTESSIVQLSTSGHSDVQLAISTGWSANNTGSLTVLNSFINDVNSNFAFVKAVRIRKANSKLLLEAKINRTGYYANSSYVSVVVSIFTNAGHNPLVTNSNNALELVSDNSNVLQEFILQDKAIIAENIVAKTITAENLNIEGLQDLISNIQEVTYSELVTLRNNSNLKTGKLYRIIDYVTEATNGVTVTGNTFDLIVEAISPNKLSSDAKAVPHALYRNPNHLGIAVQYSGNFYCIADGWKSWEYSNLPSKLKSLVSEEQSVKRYAFNLSQINAGELKIKVTSRCHRNNSVNANRVYSIPILGFDLCPSGTSDSDSSQWDDNVIASDYHKYTTSVTGGTQKTPDQITDYEYILKVPESGNYKLCIAVDDSQDILTNSSNPLRSELCVFGEIFEWIPSNYFANLPINLWELKYNLDNDNSKYIWIPRGNIAKGVIYYMKDEYGNEAPYDFKNILFDGYYTFSTIVDRKIYDSTVITTTCNNNSILPVYNTEGQQLLNAIVFKNTNIASICQYNKFGFGCKNNKFGDSCSSNEFGDYCISNTFGNRCYYNNFSMYCQSNTFGNFCQSNTFGIQCQSNTFGSYILRITFGKQCQNNKFIDSQGNNLEACRMITFGDQCNGVSLMAMTASSYSSGNWIQNIRIANGVSGTVGVIGFNTSRILNVIKNDDNSMSQYYDGDFINLLSEINDKVDSQLQNLEKNKQNTISDLDTIRSNAKLGSTAVQPKDLPVVLTGGSQTTTSTASGGSNVYTFTKSDGTTSTLTVKNGTNGTNATVSAGQGISVSNGVVSLKTDTLDEGTSDFTDGTELITSYASDDGFSKSGYTKPYKRPASAMWNYIKGKMGNTYLPLTGGTLTGSLSATAFYETSDATKKNIIDNIHLSLQDIANAPSVKFTWKNVESNPQVGTIAQYWKEVLPEVVRGEQGTYSVDYGVLATVSSISLAKTIVEQNEKISKLENEIQELKNIILKLI